MDLELLDIVCLRDIESFEKNKGEGIGGNIILDSNQFPGYLFNKSNL